MLTNSLTYLPELSIIVPCLNEAENIPLILQDINKVVEENSLSVEVILVDDSSSDDSFKIAMAHVPELPKLHLRVIRRYEPRRGYGAVVRYGVAHALGEYCIFVSADQVDPIHLLPEFLRKMRTGEYSLIQCSRYLNKGDDSTIPFKYKFYQTIFRFVVKHLLKTNIRDSTYAFKMFRRTQILALGLTQNRFSLSPEITFKTLVSGGKIDYVASAQGVRKIGKSNFIFRKEGFGFAYVILRAFLHKTRLILWF